MKIFFSHENTHEGATSAEQLEGTDDPLRDISHSLFLGISVPKHSETLFYLNTETFPLLFSWLSYFQFSLVSTFFK